MPEGSEKPRAFLDPTVLARLMCQPLASRLPMVGSVSGQHRSPHRGSSVEFAEYRQYAPGDDVRRLDWRVFGRTDRFYMKEFEADTNLRCHLVIDCSASMGFGGRGGSKIEYARRLAAALAWLAVHQGDAAGLLCVGERAVAEVPPRRSPAHLQNLFDALEAPAPRGGTGLVGSLHELAERIRPRSMVVILSDFFCDPAPLLGCLRHLRFQHHDLVLFHLLDRMELEFRFDRPVRFTDLESAFSLTTEPAQVRDEYLGHLHRFLDQLRDGCHQFNADYRRVVTDEDYERVLGGFLAERARTSGGGR